MQSLGNLRNPCGHKVFSTTIQQSSFLPHLEGSLRHASDGALHERQRLLNMASTTRASTTLFYFHFPSKTPHLSFTLLLHTRSQLPSSLQSTATHSSHSLLPATYPMKASVAVAASTLAVANGTYWNSTAGFAAPTIGYAAATSGHEDPSNG